MYKEQIRLNQAATNALMARLEAQREICDAAEKELHKKYKQRDELEKEIRPEWEQGRKRSRIDDFTFEDRDGKPVLYLPGIRPRTHLHKELRALLDEEQRGCEDGLSIREEREQEENEEELKISADNITEEKLEEHKRSPAAVEEDNSIEKKLEKLEISESKREYGISSPVLQETEPEDNEESRKQRGKGNVEKWLQMLLENSHEDMDPQETNENDPSVTEETIKLLNQKFPQKEQKTSKASDYDHKEKQLQLVEDKNSWTEKEDRIENEAGNVIKKGNQYGSTSFEGVERKEQHEKERRLVRSESARALRQIPSSPSLILGMRKGADCIGKKPTGSGTDDGSGDFAAANSFFRSPFKTLKKAVKL